MSPQTADTLIKVMLLLVGAAFGALFTVVRERYRQRSLLPIVLEQIAQASAICAEAYSPAEAQQAEPLLDKAFQSLSELVGLGVRPLKRWRSGMGLLLQTAAAVRAASAAENDAAVAALEQVRLRGKGLKQWLKTIKKKRSVFAHK